ncbi:MAG: bifunctional DNA-formamidopyrimidine glycosylase/DNA-(apurinic or apyrimidinic site) lyase [Chloroflexota bacterium]
MPELPEVETVRRELSALTGLRIVRTAVLSPHLIRCPDAERFAAGTTGKTIAAVDRQGKFLIIRLDPGSDLVVHLRMAGRMYVNDPADPVEKHTHVIFDLSDGRQLRYIDLRHFGLICLVDRGEYGDLGLLNRLGPEPLSDGFTKQYFRAGLAKRRGPIKSLLLNQEFIAGIGNIYADESLFAARIRPDRPAASLSRQEADRLWQAIRDVIADALVFGGTTFSTYRRADGSKGEFAAYLKVYGHEGAACPRCGKGQIERLRLGGRSAHFCPHCQR